MVNRRKVLTLLTLLLLVLVPTTCYADWDPAVQVLDAEITNDHYVLLTVKNVSNQNYRNVHITAKLENQEYREAMGFIHMAGFPAGGVITIQSMTPFTIENPTRIIYISAACP